MSNPRMCLCCPTSVTERVAVHGADSRLACAGTATGLAAGTGVVYATSYTTRRRHWDTLPGSVQTTIIVASVVGGLLFLIGLVVLWRKRASLAGCCNCKGRLAKKKYEKRERKQQEGMVQMQMNTMQQEQCIHSGDALCVASATVVPLPSSGKGKAEPPQASLNSDQYPTILPVGAAPAAVASTGDAVVMDTYQPGGPGLPHNRS